MCKLTIISIMKNRFLLIAISCTALLFTSCEDELDKSGNGGGGKDQAVDTYTSASSITSEKYTYISDSDSLLYNPHKLSKIQ